MVARFRGATADVHSRGCRPAGRYGMRNITPYEDFIGESRFTRLADTDAQERAIADVEKWCKKAGIPLVGGTPMPEAPSPCTTILDLTHNGSEIYIDTEGGIMVDDEEANDYKTFVELCKASLADRKKGRGVNEAKADSASGWLAIRGQWYSRLAGLVDAVADDLADRFGPLESSDLLSSSTEDTKVVMVFAKPTVGMYEAAMTAASKWLKPKEVSNVPEIGRAHV